MRADSARCTHVCLPRFRARVCLWWDGMRFSAEGTLHWVAEDQILSLNLWEGDRHFLPSVLAGEPVFGEFKYRDGRLQESRME